MDRLLDANRLALSAHPAALILATLAATCTAVSTIGGGTGGFWPSPCLIAMSPLDTGAGPSPPCVPLSFPDKAVRILGEGLFRLLSVGERSLVRLSPCELDVLL